MTGIRSVVQVHEEPFKPPEEDDDSGASGPWSELVCPIAWDKARKTSKHAFKTDWSQVIEGGK